MTLRLKWLLASCAFACTAFALPAASSASTMTLLSNERTMTQSARVVYVAIIRAKPDRTSHALGRLRQLTEDGYPEVYLALRSYTDSAGAEWTQIRIPGRPNGRVGWVTRYALGKFQKTRWRVVVNRRHLKMTVYWNGKRRWQRPVGIGKRTTPTPAGRFWIRERFTIADPSGSYGPEAFGTSAYSSLPGWPGGGVVGIHGTNEPSLIPGQPSHGCIRVPNRSIRRLARLMPIGTPIWIR